MPLAPVNELPPMPEPFEILELGDGDSITLSVERWELGRALIKPRDGREAHDIPVLRLHIPAGDKATLPAYWDVTSKHLIAGLLGHLEAGQAKTHSFTVTKHGEAPTARFALTTVPRK